jgi:hypothetical protein
MRRSSLLLCAAALLLIAVAATAQDPIPPVKPIPSTKPIPPTKPIPEMKPIPDMKPIAPADGSNVKRDADTNPKRPSKTPEDCRSSASQIRNDYNNATSEDEKRQLRRELSDLAERCGGWSALDGEPPPSDSRSNNNANSGPSSADGGGAAGDVGSGAGGGGTPSSPSPPKPIGGAAAPVLFIPYRPPGRTGAVPSFPKDLPTTLVRDEAARHQLSNAWQQVAAAHGIQPAQRADQSAQATAPPEPQSANPSDIARNGLASVAEIERETEALQAYARSLERFLGAQREGDHAAMALQSKLMTKFIDAASDAAAAAARSRAAADKLILAEMERRQAVAKLAGGWDKVLPKLGQMSVSDLPPQVRMEIKGSGPWNQGVSGLVKDLNALKPTDIDAGIAGLRARVAANAASTKGPVPLDAPSLEHEKQKAQELASLLNAAAQSK